MWIFTTKGFISLVQDKRDPNKVNVRARVAEDISSNFPGAKVYVTNGGDYRYRASIKKSEAALAIADQILNIDYISHFKDVALRGGSESRRTAYYAVWGAMARLQDYAPYSKTSREEMAKRPTTAYKGYSNGSYAGGLYDHDYGDYGAHHGFPKNGHYDDRLPANWGPLPDDIDADLPDLEEDPEIEEAIEDAITRYGHGVVDGLSEDEWEEMLESIVRENRAKEAEKAMQFTPRRSAAKRRRDRRRKRK